MFCQTCGKQLLDDAKFCDNCGSPVTTNQQTTTPQPVSPQPVTPQTFIPQPVKKRGHLMFGMILTLLLLAGTAVLFWITKIETTGWIIALAAIFVFGIFQLAFSKKSIMAAIAFFIIPALIIGGTFVFTKDSGKIAGTLSASLVSKGVNLDDLGNIMNGQYFFDDGTSQYYSSFDSNNAAHIYKTNKTDGSTKSIFDGFGWSFVVYKGWLYFSGNAGQKIDATYTLFRMKTDGSSLEHLNSTYCYGLNFYNEFLYYVKADSRSSTNYSICRSDLTGKNEQVLVQDGNGYCIVFNNKLYYSGTDSKIYSANPDGTGKTVIGTESVTYFIIGNGKIIFLDAAKNVKISDMDGKNVKLVKQAGTNPINKITSYKGTIFYVEYDSNFITDKNAWNYYLYSIKSDGTNGKKIYEGTSNGFYINVLNNKVFVLDYAKDPVSGNMPAITRNMDLDGANLKDLYR
ncbi:MAG: DUF5050 domain-containing protein [Saccharofermentanales bacterium]